jgi:UDP-MurNAc hydroxylase
MRLTHISNASCVYEADGFSLLADPWLTESCFLDQWLHEPPLKAKPKDFVDVDALYISHLHEDHLCEGTLKHFRRDIPIVTLRDKYSFCAKHLAKLGFTNIEALSDEQDFTLGPFELRMFGPFCKHPHHEGDAELGNIIDSALLVQHKGVSVLNCNDNTMSLTAAAMFREEYGAPTLAQLNSNAAGPYPACFDNLNHEQKLAERARILELQTSHMVEVAKALGAERVQPFAGQYKLRDEALNQYLAVWSDVEIAAFIKARGVKPLVLAEGESVDL